MVGFRFDDLHCLPEAFGPPSIGEVLFAGEGALEFLRLELESVGLQGVQVGHEDDLDGLGLADAPGAPRRLPHGVDGVVRLRSTDSMGVNTPLAYVAFDSRDHGSLSGWTVVLPYRVGAEAMHVGPLALAE